MSSVEKEIRRRLFEKQDLKYRAFQSKLIPTVDADTLIGVRTPELRKLAKEFSKRPDAGQFLAELPHAYYEENNLHGFLISDIGDYEETLRAVEAFLPYVDNWGTCDLLSPKVFKKNTDRLYPEIEKWIGSGKTYTVRFGLEMLLSFYLNEHFRPEMLELAAGVRSEDYYVKMMVAWYFATALAKQSEAALPYLKERRLEKETHNKAIQKAIESRRIDDAAKTYLRTLKIR